MTLPLVGVRAHGVGHVLALPPLDGIVSGPGHWLVGALPLIDIVPLAGDCGEAGLGQDPDLDNITGIS